jgi:ribose 5-phosphate isomerase A
LTDGRTKSISGITSELSPEIRTGMILGLGSGSTVASILRELVNTVGKRLGRVRVVPTSIQIQMVAEELGLEIVPLHGRIDLVIDGADQIDEGLNMIKGGGGALLKEKVLMWSSKKRIIVADEEKFSKKLCMNSVRVPVEIVPFARHSVKDRLVELHGVPHERLLPKEYPYFTENGNIILDTEFEPIERPADMEAAIKSIPGVVEDGIFTVKPIRVYRIQKNGTYAVHTAE